MDALAGTIEELHFHLPKIVLTELSREPFETNQWLRQLRTKGGYQRVERRLASLIARLPHSPQDLERRQVWHFLQNPNCLFPESRDRTGPANLPLGSLSGIIHMHHAFFLRDALYGTQGNPCQTGHLSLSVTSP
jgi:hypothetical protein